MPAKLAFYNKAAWLNSAAGLYLQAREQTLYDEAIVDLFGFHALQMGFAQIDLLRHSRISNRYIASEYGDARAQNHISCHDDFLPFADMSLDLLLLPHRLEFSARPHQTLREAARVIVPDGHLLISGFNPLSLWGAKAQFKNAFLSSASYPWSGRFVGLARLKDWLTLLGFELISVQMCCHVPPFAEDAWHRRFSLFDKIKARRFLIMGGIYFIVAKKRVIGMTPIKPHWKLNALKTPLIIRSAPTKPTQHHKNKLKKHE